MSDLLKKHSDVFVDSEWTSSDLFPLQVSTPTPGALSSPTVKVTGEDFVVGNLQMRDSAFGNAMCLPQTPVRPPCDVCTRFRLPAWCRHLHVSVE